MKPKANKTNKQFLRDMANAELRPLIEHCRANRGAKADVCRRLNRLLPEAVSLTQIGNWLNESAGDRAVPTHPVGRLLLKVWAEIEKDL